jgi:hypothetical protein
MKKKEFETKLMIGIAAHRLSLLREPSDHNLFYSGQMHEPEDDRKIYLLELDEDSFILRSDLIFNDPTHCFFYVSKERLEFSENNLKVAFASLRTAERKVYEILSKLNIRGYYTKNSFALHLVKLIPQLELVNNTVKDRKSGKTFVTIKEDILYFVYKDGKLESYMNIAKKDLNENILQQCIELIKAALKYEEGT